jgi:hypothetical protein
MAVPTPAAEALAGLAMSASLMEALLKRGVIEQQDVDPIIRDAASYVAAFCTDCGAEVEREALRLLALIGKTGRDVLPPETSPIPVVDPAGS